MKTSSMHIRLSGLQFHAFHGVLPQERVVGADYTVSLRLATDFRKAAEHDDLQGTVNYAEVYEAVKQEMALPSQLVEHVAWRIGRRILHDFPSVSTAEVAVYKQNPPMGAQCEQVGVEITCSR